MTNHITATAYDLDPSFQKRLQWVLSHHAMIAESLKRAEQQFFGVRRRQCRSLCRFFRDSPDPNRVAHRPDVFAICSPLLTGPLPPESASSRLQPDQIDRAVAAGLGQIQRFHVGHGRTTILLGYPLLILTLGVSVLIGYLIFLVPVFDEMFQEFGLQLGNATALIIGLSRLIHGAPLVVAVIAMILPTAFLCVIVYERLRDLPVWYGMMGRLFTSRKERLAEWAAHLAMLYTSNLSLDRAIRIAGDSSSDAWIRSRCQRWAIHNSDDSPLKKGPWEAETGCHLLAHAMRHCNVEGTVSRRVAASLLNDAASIYHSSVRHKRLQWMGWISPITLCLVATVLGCVLMALFAPLLSLITALSS